MSGYTSKISKISEISEDAVDAMARLYLRYYDGSSESQFRQDLSKKSEVLQIYYDDLLIGFSAYQFYLHEWDSQTIRIVYSGDTIVDRQHWGQQSLAFNWLARMGELKRQQPDIPMYWFLIVKGHRTYRYLPAFAKSFFPHWTDQDAELASLASELATEKFGADYNPKTGIIEFRESKGHLKKIIAEPNEQEKSKQAVKYFLQRNPNYLSGHELVCLYKFDENNMKSLTRRVFSRGLS